MNINKLIEELVNVDYYDYKTLSNKGVNDIRTISELSTSDTVKSIIRHYNNDYKNFCQGCLITGKYFENNFLAVASINDEPASAAFVVINSDNDAVVRLLGVNEKFKNSTAELVLIKKCMKRLDNYNTNTVNVYDMGTGTVRNSLVKDEEIEL